MSINIARFRSTGCRARPLLVGLAVVGVAAAVPALAGAQARKSIGFTTKVRVNAGSLAKGRIVTVRGLVRHPNAALRPSWSAATVAEVVRHGVNGRYQQPYRQRHYRCTPSVKSRTTRFVCLLGSTSTVPAVQFRFAARYRAASSKPQPPLGSAPPVGIDWGNTCTVNLTNDDAGIYLQTTSSSNWNTDHWNTSPDGKYWDGVITHFWKDAGGADRGCGDSVTLTAGAASGEDPNLFTMTISETDPWTGANSYACTITAGQDPASAYACDLGTGSTTTGDELNLNYQIVGTS